MLEGLPPKGPHDGVDFVINFSMHYWSREAPQGVAGEYEMIINGQHGFVLGIYIVFL